MKSGRRYYITFSLFEILLNTFSICELTPYLIQLLTRKNRGELTPITPAYRCDWVVFDESQCILGITILDVANATIFNQRKELLNRLIVKINDFLKPIQIKI